ncbi:hypothetical protein EGR_01002 [Echinococcus granulosus]|uniref:Uncharacterized protein n=1 Tax=Echinococcus granulosus TaxID=6210 RepID=W6UT66_ECHGR|nr:hypothetical protein EGR_01002 [Echinococcus granulosus]EUB64458.1 hypothetical protein EGR_01002 [Echinococcus granulosus]
MRSLIVPAPQKHQQRMCRPSDDYNRALELHYAFTSPQAGLQLSDKSWNQTEVGNFAEIVEELKYPSIFLQCLCFHINYAETHQHKIKNLIEKERITSSIKLKIKKSSTIYLEPPITNYSS